MRTLKIVVFEDDRRRRHRMAKVIRETEPDAEVIVFRKTVDVSEYVQKYYPEVAFISMENADGRGYFLIKKLSQLSPQTNIIAVASEYRYAQELMNLRISGYVTEDLTKELVTEEMNNLRYRKNAYG